MGMSDDLRWIKLLEADDERPPLWSSAGGIDPEYLKLSDDLSSRILTWANAAADFDPTPHRTGRRHLSNPLQREDAELSQAIADELGEGVAVRFESDTFYSMSPPTNPGARGEFEEFVAEEERLLRLAYGLKTKKRRR